MTKDKFVFSNDKIPFLQKYVDERYFKIVNIEKYTEEFSRIEVEYEEACMFMILLDTFSAGYNYCLK